MKSMMEEAIDLLAAVAMAASPGLSRERALARVRLEWHLTRLAQQGGAGASMRELERAIRSVPPAELRRAVRDRQAAGRVEAITVPSGPRGGRPTVRYRLAEGHNPSSPARLAPTASGPE